MKKGKGCGGKEWASEKVIGSKREDGIGRWFGIGEERMSCRSEATEHGAPRSVMLMPQYTQTAGMECRVECKAEGAPVNPHTHPPIHTHDPCNGVIAHRAPAFLASRNHPP